jgi:hypothetical protein
MYLIDQGTQALLSGSVRARRDHFYFFRSIATNRIKGTAITTVESKSPKTEPRKRPSRLAVLL